MQCYRCNGTLDLKKDTCTKCGTDTRMYKKIVYTSNRYYNSALRKAASRNLTGAKEDLEQSLFLYKKNIQARNLLGLVNYAMGEPAEALKEWVISKNLAPESHAADRYINNMRHSLIEMDSEGHGVKKLNQAITYVNNDARDMALISLKKICSVHTNMTKAYNLLALLYMQDGKYEQAKKTLAKCLAVDSGNATAFRYLKEIQELEMKNGQRFAGTVGEEEREQLIIPVRFRDYGSYLANALYILLGLVLGLLIAWFVILPGRVQRETGKVEEQVRSLEAENSSLELELAIKKADAELSSEVYSIPQTDESGNEVTETEPEKPIETIPDKPEMIASWRLNQEAVDSMVRTINIPDYPATLRTFATVDPSQLSETNQKHYRNIVASLFDMSVRNVMYESAAKYYARGQFDNAANYYDALWLVFPADGGLKIQAGLSFEHLGDWDTAANRYWQAAVLYPDTEAGREGASRYLTITKKTEIPPLPEGFDAEEYTRERTAAYYLNKMNN